MSRASPSVRRRLPAAVALLAVAGLAPGCAPREAALLSASPEAMAGPAPTLVPTESFAAAAAGSDPAAVAAGGAGLAARAAGLRARAAGLAGPVVPSPERERLEAGPARE